MITMIRRVIHDENGSVAVEGTFVTLFFSILLIYSMQQAMTMSTQFGINKLANQIVNVVAQRDGLFDNKNLSQNDMNSLSDMFTQLKPKSGKPLFDVFVEEVSYATGHYSMYKISGDKADCQLKRKLSDYGIHIQTSYEKSNSIYRVSVCRKVEPGLFMKSKYLIAESAVQIGHHH